MLQAAARIADGQVPYGDFWWFYPPGQPYLLALPVAAVRPLAPDLADRARAVRRRRGRLAWRCSPGAAAASHPVALATWLAAALAMAFPSGPHPFPLALAMALGALLLMERRPVLAGGLAGLAALWRIEFAAYLGLGVLLAYAMRPVPRRQQAEAAALFAGSALAVAAALYAPGRAHGRAGRLLRPADPLPGPGLLPVPVACRSRSTTTASLNTSSVGGFFSDSAESLLLFYLPLALMIGLAGSGGRARAALRARAVVAAGRRRVRHRHGPLPGHAPGRLPHGAARRDGLGAGAAGRWLARGARSRPACCGRRRWWRWRWRWRTRRSRARPPLARAARRPSRAAPAGG